jgi:hypothetical protein
MHLGAAVSLGLGFQSCYQKSEKMQSEGGRGLMSRMLEFSFAKNVTPGVGLENFWKPEDEFVWSSGKWCQILFDVPARSADPDGGEVELVLDLDAFRAAPELEGQDLHVYVNGLRVATRHVTKRIMIVAEVARHALREHANSITIDTPDAARPSDFGEVDDRRLGIKLFSVKLRGV